MNRQVEEMALNLDGETAKRTLWVICRLNLGENPLEEKDLEEIIVDARYDSYFANGFPGSKDPLHMLSLSGPDGDQYPLLDAEYADWCDAVQNSPDI